MAIRLFLVLILMSGILAITPFFASNSQAQTAGATGSLGQSGLLIPRFVSLKSNRVNVRGGPSTNYEVLGKVVYGEAAEIISDPDADWVKIRIEGDGVEGFIMKRFMTDVDPLG
ncbi:MAG: SH3 domain-containing protein [Rhizobiales bacterium]|nr:SH3 domain-containing protein [Hyphomicrobiales bacterium]